MNTEEKKILNQLIKENNTIDNTPLLREQKNSQKIKQDIDQILYLLNKYPKMWKNSKTKFINMAKNKCLFIFQNYKRIFDKLINKTINLPILGQFVGILKEIEDGEIDQHEGSFMVGKLLKKIYIDGALDSKKKKKNPKNNISWKQFKTMNNH